ncbi:MAG TPA: pyridoxamine 5'-phosphate oxidase family protein [Candidatus Binatia bacterium]|jgi:nitroimidazol reductase NimA-like FMN-containing flavoprotein (pyridoxamine 5'-phosphate oxidase superfamily)|nr:pyridoxamine 5'-phosphate oxidase family protein [Candidatus Binatia bacterium]
MTRDEREAFLAGARVGILGVDEPGRGPLSVPVWYLYEPGGDVVFVTRPEARKAGLLTAGTPVSFLVQSEDMPPKYVSIQGRVVSATPADVERDVKPVVRKYLGADVGDSYVDATRPTGTNEIVVRIRPGRWYSRDFGRTGA